MNTTITEQSSMNETSAMDLNENMDTSDTLNEISAMDLNENMDTSDILNEISELLKGFSNYVDLKDKTLNKRIHKRPSSGKRKKKLNEALLRIAHLQRMLKSKYQLM